MVGREGRIGPYRILKLIQEGGQARVYLGYDDRLHRRVAIKIRPLPPLREARRACLEEARLSASVHSPKIVQVYDVIESDTHLAMVMEYVPGCTLEEFLSQKRPSLASTVTVGQDLAVALTRARQQGVVHGDIKAGNVLLARDGHARLGDFGISRRPLAGFSSAGGAGTLSALSPEHYRGETVDHRSDLFALGIILYRMLGGVHPFYRDGQFDVDALLADDVRPLSELVDAQQSVPEALLQLVEGLLRKNPADRVDTTLRVRQVLLAVSRDLPVEEADCLLRESSPHFRVEATGDLPQRLPGGFDKRVRFHYIQSGGWRGRVWHWLKTTDWWRKGAAVFATAALFTAPVAAAIYYSDTVVRFGQPAVSTQGEPLPSTEINAQWLLAQVKGVMQKELGRLDVIGDVDAGPRRTVYSPTAQLLRPQVADEQYNLGLRCVEGICVFAVSRHAGNVRLDEQAVLFADMSVQQWRDIIRRTTAALYD